MRLAGQPTHTTRVITPRVSALKSMSASASDKERTDSSGPPSATSLPSNGRVWTRMMITPTPDMNPETTEYGV